MTQKRAPEVLLCNQMAGPIAIELARAVADAADGRCILLSGHPEARAADGKFLVRKAPVYRRGSLVRRSGSWLSYLLVAAWQILRRPSATRLVLFSNPPLLPVLGWLVKSLRGQRYSVVVYDIYPDVLEELGVLRRGGIVARVWRYLNRRAYEGADRVITIGDRMAERLERGFDPGRTADGRIHVVPPWVDTDVIRPIPKAENPFARSHDQVGKLTLLYSGNMGLAHDLETVLAAARRLRGSGDVHFMIIGAGPKWPLVRDTVARESLENVTVLPWQPREVLPSVLATGDLALVSLEPGLEGLAVPSKSVYAFAAGSALIAITSGRNELRDWIGEYGCGADIEPGDVDALMAVIDGYRNDPDRLACHRERARAASLAHHARGELAPAMARLLLGRPPAEPA